MSLFVQYSWGWCPYSRAHLNHLLNWLTSSSGGTGSVPPWVHGQWRPGPLTLGTRRPDVLLPEGWGDGSITTGNDLRKSSNRASLCVSAGCPLPVRRGWRRAGRSRARAGALGAWLVSAKMATDDDIQRLGLPSTVVGVRVARITSVGPYVFCLGGFCLGCNSICLGCR